MRKSLLIGLIVCVLAVGGIGAAFAAGISSWDNVGVLSLGTTSVETVGVDYIGYHLNSAQYEDVVVDGVYISLDTYISGTNAVSVSLRAANGDELCYYAANNVTWLASETRLVPMITDQGNLPTANQVYKVKVVVATNSHYN